MTMTGLGFEWLPDCSGSTARTGTVTLRVLAVLPLNEAFAVICAASYVFGSVPGGESAHAAEFRVLKRHDVRGPVASRHFSDLKSSLQTHAMKEIQVVWQTIFLFNLIEFNKTWLRLLVRSSAKEEASQMPLLIPPQGLALGE